MMYKATIGDRDFEVTFEDDKLRVNGEEPRLDVSSLGNGAYHVLLNDKSYRVYIHKTGTHEYEVRVNGRRYTTGVKDNFDLLLEKLGMSAADAGKVDEIKAPMPGLVLKLLVEEGQEVEKDTPLLVLEAMKMENMLKSPGAGKVKTVHVDRQQPVEKNQVLISFE